MGICWLSFIEGLKIFWICKLKRSDIELRKLYVFVFFFYILYYVLVELIYNYIIGIMS